MWKYWLPRPQHFILRLRSFIVPNLATSVSFEPGRINHFTRSFYRKTKKLPLPRSVPLSLSGAETLSLSVSLTFWCTLRRHSRGSLRWTPSWVWMCRCSRPSRTRAPAHPHTCPWESSRQTPRCPWAGAGRPNLTTNQDNALFNGGVLQPQTDQS